MEGGCFTSVHWKMENKEHNGQEQNEGAGRNACPVVCSFPCKKASQMYVRPFCGADLPCPKLHVG